MALNAVALSDADQCAHLNQLVTMLLPISPVRKADLLVLARSLPFRHDYVRILEAKITALKEGGSGLWQDWSTIHMYINDAMVSAWSDRGPPEQNTLIWQLLQFAELMGLHKPNQQPFQSLTTLILILVKGTNWSPVDKKNSSMR